MLLFAQCAGVLFVAQCACVLLFAQCACVLFVAQCAFVSGQEIKLSRRSLEARDCMILAILVQQNNLCKSLYLDLNTDLGGRLGEKDASGAWCLVLGAWCLVLVLADTGAGAC